MEVACLLLAFLSATTSASWIFPDDKQPIRDSRDDEGTQEDLKLLSLVSGQPPSTSAHHGLKLLRHLLQAQRNNVKVPRSLDTPRHLVHPPAGYSSSRGSLIPEQFELSKSCCKETGFKPSTYFSTTALRNVDAAPYKRTETTTHKPVQIYNAINVYKPIFNSHVITTYRPDFTSDDVIIPAHRYTRTTTANPAHSSVMTSKPTHTTYHGTASPSHIDTPAVTTYRPKYNHIQIPNYKSSPASKYKSTSSTSTATSQVSNNKPQHLPHGDHRSTKTFKPKRQGRGYRYGYDVSSQHHGTSFGHHELSDGDVVRGEYRVRLPDGRLQVVTYTADGERGFLPVVRYEAPPPTATTHFQLPT